MKKKILAAMTLVCVALCTVTGCDKSGKEPGRTGAAEDTEDPSNKAAEVSPFSMSVNKKSGQMEITRPESEEIPMGEDGTWTVFVYITGSNLESDYGSATDDISEMCWAKSSDKVKFVVETGGAEDWQNDYADSGKIGRFLVENNDVTLLEHLDNANMGDSATLTDFLQWGIGKYPADHMGLILWDHGGGSISGVCFDDLYYSDSLTLRELDSSLYTVFGQMTDRFEFIGFDACLMGTVETANILASYSRYMIGSQEIEPGSGWDYSAMGDFLAANPDANGAEVGKAICDGYYESCKADDSESDATLSVIDLGKIDDVIMNFNSFAMDMYTASEETSVLSSIIREMRYVDNFGGNNDDEGYTNMVDLSGMIQACSEYANGADVLQAIESAVVYNKTGFGHEGCCGLSIYYPLSVEGSEELGIFEEVTISPFYASFVDRQDFTSSIYYNPEDYYDEEETYDTYYDEENGYYYFNIDGTDYCYDENYETYWWYDTENEEWALLEDSSEFDYDEYNYDDSYDDIEYSDDYWFDEDDWWQCYLEYEWDAQSHCYRAKSKSKDHWNYADNFEMTGESRFITFLKEPSFDKDGIFGFTLDAKGIEHSADVYGLVMQVMDGSDSALLLGETYDIYGDWETGHFEDGFNGYWLSLPDGQNLDITIVSFDDDYVVYSSSILLNGKETNLRIRQTLEDAKITVEGTWDGIDENGSAARAVVSLKPEDVIAPRYLALSFDEDGEDKEWTGEEYKVGSDFNIVYAPLASSDYLYAFCVDDIYFDYYLSEFVEFNVNSEGGISYYKD